MVPFRRTEHTNGKPEIVFRDIVSDERLIIDAVRFRNVESATTGDGSYSLKIKLAEPNEEVVLSGTL